MSSQIFKTPLPYLALLLAHIIWGGNYVVAKVTLVEIPMMSLAFLRFGLACLLILPFLNTIEAKHKRIKIEHLPRLIAAAMLMAVLNIAFFYNGLSKTTAIDASVLELSVPLISVLGAWWVLKERIFLINLMGVFLGLFGAMVIIGVPLLFLGDISRQQLLGDLLIIIGSVSFVTGSLILKRLLKSYSPIVITSFTFLVASVAFFIPALLEYLNDPGWVYRLSILGFLGLMYITFMSSIVAYFLLMWGISKIELSHANLVQYIEPAVAATLAVPLLNERISFSFIIGTCLIILGVYWGTLGRQEHHHAHHKSHRI